MTAADEVDEEERHVPTSGGNNASGSSTAVDASQGAGADASMMHREPTHHHSSSRPRCQPRRYCGNATPLNCVSRELMIPEGTPRHVHDYVMDTLRRSPPPQRERSPSRNRSPSKNPSHCEAAR